MIVPRQSGTSISRRLGLERLESRLLLDAVSGTKWIDLNGDGAMDIGEPGLGGVEIYADLNENGVLDGGEPVTTTAADGTYTIDDLSSGSYQIREVVPAGYAQTFPGGEGYHPVDLDGAESGLDFGNEIVGGYNEISGVKWDDLDGDGVYDVEDEPLLAGVTIYADINQNGVLDAGEPSTVTDEYGYFLFVPDGLYQVREVVPDGYTQTFPGGEGYHTVDLTGGEGYAFDTDFGNFAETAAGSISGTKWRDDDGDGVWDGGEVAMEGVTIYLDLDEDGELDAGEPETVTDINGDYVFDDVPAGDYIVREVAPAGFFQTYPVGGAGHDVTLVGGEGGDLVDLDFGNQSLTGGEGSISGIKWNDLDGDGVRDVDLIVSTDSDVVFVVDVSYSTANPFAGTPIGDVNGDGIPDTILDAQLAGFIALNNEMIRLGIGETAEVAIIVFGATALNLDVDASLPGLQAVTLPSADADGNGMLDVEQALRMIRPGYMGVGGGSTNFEAPLQLTQSTFDELGTAPGDGVVIFLSDGHPNAGGTFEDEADALRADEVALHAFGVGLTASLNDLQVIDPAAEVFTTTDELLDLFGDLEMAGGGDGGAREPVMGDVTVYLDLNNNGVLDAGEPQTVTDTEGAYSFDNLPPGTYVVREVVPDGFAQTYPGGDGAHTVDVDYGEFVTDIDFGNELATSEIHGTKWDDLDGDGAFDGPLVTGENPDIVFIIDVSYSTGAVFGGTSVGDVNGDGSFDTILDAQLAAYMALNDALVDQGLGWDAQVAIIVFGVEAKQLDMDPDAPGFQLSTVPLADTDATGTPDIEEILQSILPGALGAGGAATNFEDPLQVALDVVEQMGSGIGEANVIFMSDGYANAGGSYDDEVGALRAAGANLRGFGVGTTASLEYFQTIDGAARVFTTTDDLLEVFTDIYGAADGVVEPGMEGVTVFIDQNGNGVLDGGEPSAVTDESGHYVLSGLTAATYTVCEVVPDDYGQTYPAVCGCGERIEPPGESNPAVGDVNPLLINLDLGSGEQSTETVSITLPEGSGVVSMVDVFLLFDDTGSFAGTAPTLIAEFPTVITQLQLALPEISFGFGVGRFEDFGGALGSAVSGEDQDGRPFTLNQPIIMTDVGGFDAAVNAALSREAPGYGGDGPETMLDGLYQVATGAGLDGDGNGSMLDSGAAGLAATQTMPGYSGDVPPFSSFTADPANNVLTPSGTLGGAGFRAGALPVILVASDVGTVYRDDGADPILGVGGSSLPLAQFLGYSRGTSPDADGDGIGDGASVQQTIDALNALGALVIGLGTNSSATSDPRQVMEAIATVTGAVNGSDDTIDSGIVGDPIEPGDPFYFQIQAGAGESVADGIVAAVQGATTSVSFDIDLAVSDPTVAFTNLTGVQTGVEGGETVPFDVRFTSDGVARRFDLEFVRAGTSLVLGSIPVVMYGVEGDATLGCHTVTLGPGETVANINFGNRGPNEAPTIYELIACPNPVIMETLTLTAEGVDDTDGVVTEVAFFHDANANGVLDAGDGLLGIDADGSDGWSFATDTTDWTAGDYSFLAVATDNRGDSSPSVGTDVLVLGKVFSLTDPLGRVTVTIFDVEAPLDVFEDDVVVKFGPSSTVSLIRPEGDETMGGLGIVVTGATNIYNIKDRRENPGMLAFIATNSPVRNVALDSGIMGFDLDGRTFGFFHVPNDLDGDGTPGDPISFYTTRTAGHVSLCGDSQGYFHVGGIGADGGLALKSFSVDSGNFHGELFVNGDAGNVNINGDFGSSVNVAGSLNKLKVKGGDLMGEVSVGGHLGNVSVDATRVKAKGPAPLVGGNVLGACFEVGGKFKFLNVDGDFLNSDVDAGFLQRVTVRGTISQTDAGGHVIHAAGGTFVVKDLTGRARITEAVTDLFGGILAYVGEIIP